MDPSGRALSPVLPAVAGISALALAVILLLVPVPDWLRALLPAGLAVAALFAVLRSCHAETRARRALEEKLAFRDRDASQLRHDLRGILSPAMLTADRLSTNADPVVRRAGETMVSTVERAEQRLRGNPSPPPS